MNRNSRAALLATTLLASVSLSTLGHAQEVNDPIEPINRGIFAINEVLDMVIVKPIATIYNTVLPKPVRTG